MGVTGKGESKHLELCPRTHLLAALTLHPRPYLPLTHTKPSYLTISQYLNVFVGCLSGLWVDFGVSGLSTSWPQASSLPTSGPWLLAPGLVASWLLAPAPAPAPCASRLPASAPAPAAVSLLRLLHPCSSCCLLQHNWPNTSKLLQHCYTTVAKLFQNCCKTAPKLLQHCCSTIAPTLIQNCSKTSKD